MAQEKQTQELIIIEKETPSVVFNTKALDTAINVFTVDSSSPKCQSIQDHTKAALAAMHEMRDSLKAGDVEQAQELKSALTNAFQQARAVDAKAAKKTFIGPMTVINMMRI